MLVERLISCCKEVRSPTPIHLPIPFPAFAKKNDPLRFCVCVNSVILSDRDRTFAAQCRAHAAFIHVASRRVGEEGEQGREDGSRGGDEWGKLTVTGSIAEASSPFQCILPHTHTPFFLSPHTWNNQFRSAVYQFEPKCEKLSVACKFTVQSPPRSPLQYVSDPSSFTTNKLVALLCSSYELHHCC
jgi:hypothetical protein